MFSKFFGKRKPIPLTTNQVPANKFNLSRIKFDRSILLSNINASKLSESDFLELEIKLRKYEKGGKRVIFRRVLVNEKLIKIFIDQNFTQKLKFFTGNCSIIDEEKFHTISQFCKISNIEFEVSARSTKEIIPLTSTEFYLGYFFIKTYENNISFTF